MSARRHGSTASPTTTGPASRWASESGDAVETHPRAPETVSRLDVDDRPQPGQLVVEASLDRVVGASPQDAVGYRLGDEDVADAAGAQARKVTVRVGRSSRAGKLQIEHAPRERRRRGVDRNLGAGRE